jgi:hypothetical protein
MAASVGGAEQSTPLSSSEIKANISAAVGHIHGNLTEIDTAFDSVSVFSCLMVW